MSLNALKVTRFRVSVCEPLCPHACTCKCFFLPPIHAILRDTSLKFKQKMPNKIHKNLAWDAC